MGDNTDVDLGAPLLAEHNHDHDITLNGDSINLRDLLLGGNAALDINREEEQTSTTPSLAASDSSSDNKNIASNKGVEKSSPTGSTTDPSYVVLSLDDNRSSFTATDHHVTQSIRRGRSVYYRAKRHLSNIVAALKRTRNENYNISDVHDGKNGIRQITQKSSLSSSKSTSPFLKLLIPPLLIFNHFIFYQAQTKVSTSVSCVMILHTTLRSMCTHFSQCSNIIVTTISANVESCILDQCNYHCYGYYTEI